LNQNDFFKVRFICIGKKPTINNISAHIKDVNEIQIIDSNISDVNGIDKAQYHLLLFVSLLGFLLGLFSVLTSGMNDLMFGLYP